MQRQLARLRQRPLLPLLLLFLALALMHNWATPIFEGPDEAQHYAYVRWIAREHHLPPLSDAPSDIAQEVAQPPLYYLTAALLTAPLDDGDLLHHLWHNPGFGYQGTLTGHEDKNMLIHLDEFRGWDRGVFVLHATRLVSTLFGLLTVVAAWGWGWELFGTRHGALTVAAMVALQPQFVFISSVVSNDSAAAAMATASLWALTALWRRGPSLRRLLTSGLLVGAAAETKMSLLPLVGAAYAVIGLAALRAEPRRRRRAIVRAWLSFSLPMAVLALPWYLRNLIVYDDLLALMPHLQTPWHYDHLITWRQVLDNLPMVWRSFWGAYGWGHICWPDAVYWLLFLLTVPPFLLGLRSLRRDPLPFGLALGWLIIIACLLLRWMRVVEAPHGRLLFPAIGAWAALMTAGLSSLPGAWRRSLLGVMAVLAALAPGSRILATFAPPRQLDAAEAGGTVLLYGDEARLQAVRLPERRLHPGDDFTVTLCWAALRPMTTDYTLFVHLLGPNDAILAARHTWPGNGRYPTSRWTQRPFCDGYRLHIPDEVEAPMRYPVEVGLFEEERGLRPVARTEEGRVVAPPIVGGIIVVPEGPPPPPRFPLDGIRLGERIALRGYDRPLTATAGSPLTVTLHWEALGAPGESDVAFVHLWREGDPQPLAQDDAPPRGGWFPTTLWQAGDRIPDTHILHLPDDLPAGRYPLWAGLYRAEDGSRLPAFRDGTRLPYDLVPLGTVEITTKE